MASFADAPAGDIAKGNADETLDAAFVRSFS